MRTLALLLALCLPAVAGEPKDELLRAMSDELARTMARLRMNNLERPYYAAYTVVDDDRMQVEASFGALKDPHRHRTRSLKAEIRVGGPGFDQTHYVAKDYWRYRPFTDEMVIDDDYDALRYSLWSLSDSAYKYAVEKLAQKRAYKNARNIVEEVADLSTAPASSYYEPSAEPPYDDASWRAKARAVSSAFRNFPAVQACSVNFYWSRRQRRLADSEGRRILQPANDFEVYMTASAQAADGMPLSDRRRVIRQSLAEMPGVESLSQEAEALARDLSALSAAPVLEDYIGPVLLEGQASGEFFNQLLARNLSFPRAPWLEEEHQKESFGSGEFAERLGLRVLSPLLDVYDDPGLSSLGGVPLLGRYRNDDEGVPGERVHLVKKGILMDLLMSRSPVKRRARSNGHGRGGFQEFVSARVGNLVVEPSAVTAPERLKAELLARAKDYGLSHALIVRRIGEEDTQEKDELLAAPVLVYKVAVSDGKEELVRGARFSGVTLRALRDIVAASEKPAVYNYYQLGPDRNNRGQTQASIVAPAVLIAEMELKKLEKKPEKKPTLPRPELPPQ